MHSVYQGHDLEMATNCLGPFILNHLLEPILARTASADSGSRSVRVVWVSSMIAASVPPGGIQFEKSGTPKVLKNAMQNYMQSKVGNVFLASEAARRLGRDGIINVVSIYAPDMRRGGSIANMGSERQSRSYENGASASQS